MINGYFLFVLATVLGFFLLDFVGRLLNLSALKPELPAEFQDVFDSAEYSKSQDYTREGTRFSLIEDTCSLIVFLVFWCALELQMLMRLPHDDDRCHHLRQLLHRNQCD